MVWCCCGVCAWHSELRSCVCILLVEVAVEPLSFLPLLCVLRIVCCVCECVCWKHVGAAWSVPGVCLSRSVCWSGDDEEQWLVCAGASFFLWLPIRLHPCVCVCVCGARLDVVRCGVRQSSIFAVQHGTGTDMHAGQAPHKRSDSNSATGMQTPEYNGKCYHRVPLIWRKTALLSLLHVESCIFS